MDLSKDDQWRNLVIIYQKLKDGCCCSENEIEMKQTINSSVESYNCSEANQLHICLLGLSIIKLLGKLIRQKRQELCTKLQWLSKNIVSADVINKLTGILLGSDNKHIVYSIRTSIIAILFNYPKRISAAAESYVLSTFSQLISENKVNCDVLEVLRDIMLFHTPEIQPLHSNSMVKCTFEFKSHHKYNLDDRTNEIKENCIAAVVSVWNNLSLLLNNKGFSDEVKFVILDMWSCIVTTSLTFEMPIKDVLAERYRKEILDVSNQSSFSMCVKLFTALNQVFTVNYLQVTQIPPLEIIDLSEDIVVLIKKGCLSKFALKSSCNNFIGKKVVRNSEVKKVCPVQLRNIILVILKSLCISIKSSGRIIAEDVILVFNVLQEWLSMTWNKSKNTCHTDQECLLELFLDQDDQLLEMMVCNLNIYLYINEHRVDSLSETKVMHSLNPHKTFLHFIQELDYDYSLLLDLLMSNETCALLYILQYLKLVRFEWHTFIQTHQMVSKKNQVDHKGKLFKSSKESHSNQSFDRLNIDDRNNASTSNKSVGIRNADEFSVHVTMEMLTQLRSTIQKLLDKDLFPYNVRPLIRILKDCENVYNCNKIT